MKRIIKLSRTSAVDRRKVVGVHMSLDTLKTVVFPLGMPAIESDFGLDETIEMLEKGEQHDFPSSIQT